LRSAWWVVVLSASAVAASGQTQSGRPAKRVEGLSYDLRMTSAPTSGTGLATAMGNVSQSYVGRALVVGGRGRLDILEGGLQPLFSKGDYLLFDSTGITVVRPASQEYVPVSPELKRVMEDLDALAHAPPAVRAVPAPASQEA